ncbi:MAG: ABC transporter permease [Chloroflexi bacterium]|nr:ABC transporter permease [Chloroflexota bacterium]
MQGFKILFKKEVWESWATNKIFIIAGIFLFFSILTPFIMQYMGDFLEMSGIDPSEFGWEPTAADTIISFLDYIILVAIFAPAFLVMGVVAKELSDGITATTLVKPVGRLAYILSKYLVYLSVFIITATISAFICYFYTVAAIGDLDIVDFVASLLPMLLLLAFCVALTLLFSTIFKSQMAAGGTSAGVMFALYIISFIPFIGEISPFRMSTWSHSIIQGSQEVSVLPLITAVVCLFVFIAYSISLLKKKEI